MKGLVQEFFLMLQFFTRVPVKRNLPCTANNFRRGVVFLPFVGFLIGGLQYGFLFLLQERLPSTILAVIGVLLPIIITGGLHIDGLGDTCDGFFAITNNKNRILEIMSDSSAGTYAICAIISNILLQYVAIEYIIRENSIHVLLVIIMFSKLFVLFTAMWGKPAKKQGSGNIFIGNMSWVILMIGTIYSLGVSMITVTLITSLWLLLSGAIVSVLFYFLCYKKIGGITGDTLGATQELATNIMLIVYCAIII